MARAVSHSVIKINDNIWNTDKSTFVSKIVQRFIVRTTPVLFSTTKNLRHAGLLSPCACMYYTITCRDLHAINSES